MQTENLPPKLPPPQAPTPVIVPEVLPPALPPFAGQSTGPPPVMHQGLSKGRLMAAFIVAVISDVLSVVAQVWPPAEVALDIVTAAVLFMVLGWRWPLLIGLVMEAIPGVALFPAWVMVVGAIAVFGSARPTLR